MPVRILRDTGAPSPCCWRERCLSEKTAPSTHVLVRSIKMGFLEVPLHPIHLSSGLVTGRVIVGIRSSLPVSGV